MKVYLFFLILCVSMACPVDIRLPGSKMKDDDLLEAAIFKALSLNGAMKVKVDNYMRMKAAYTVETFIDPGKVTDVAENLKQAIEELGFANFLIEETEPFGSKVKEGILNRFVIYLDEETFMDVMKSFAGKVAETTDVKVEFSRLD